MNEIIPPPPPADDDVNVDDTPAPTLKMHSQIKPITASERLEMANSMRQQAMKLIEYADRINPENQCVMIVNRVEYERKMSSISKIAAELKYII